ncbi:MAG: polysaccharide biosynthesis tyrosine autokinase [Planctomyces sp.]|nr:polysaccharide biosynthesis tyrosine autokinase [Planctomyces sp.]
MSSGNTAHGPAATVENLDVVAWMVRFLKTARARKNTLLLCFFAFLCLGGVRYATSTRLFESHAEVLVLEQGGSVLEKDRGQGSTLTDQMPNFERVFTSDRVLKQTLRELPPEFRRDFLGKPADTWLDVFRERLSVSTARRTNVIQVGFRSKDPETAHFVVSSLVSSSLEFLNTMHSDSALEMLKMLQKERKQIEQELQRKHERQIRLTRESQVLFGSEEKVVNVLNEGIIRLNQDRIEARKETIDARSLLLALQSAVRNREDVQAFALKLNESLATELFKKSSGLAHNDSLTVSRLEQMLVDDRATLQNKLGRLGEKHPEIVAMKDRIRNTQAYLATRQAVVSESADQQNRDVLGPRLLEIARHRAAMAQSREQELDAEFEAKRELALSTNAQVAEVQKLNLDIKQLQDYHKLLLDRMRALDLGREAGVRAKVITDPRINREPVAPKLSLILLLSVAAGLGTGLVAVYVMDLIDDHFRSPDDIRQQVGAPILTMVRKLPQLAPHGLESLYPFARPTSVESESFRSLRTAIDFSGTETRSLTISSTEPGDGKTTVVASLAVAFAQAGKRTLAIDGDMRRPGLTKLFNLGQRAGLSNLLKSDRPIEELVEPLIYRPDLPNLDIISSGPRPSNPAELLSSDRLPELIAWAEGRYDQILVDAPPSLAVSDVQIIGRVVDGSLLTIRPNRNRRKMVLRAVESLTALGCPLIGIVVNQLSVNNGDEYSYGYGYGYGYEYHDDARDESGAAEESQRLAA